MDNNSRAPTNMRQGAAMNLGPQKRVNETTRG